MGVAKTLLQTAVQNMFTKQIPIAFPVFIAMIIKSFLKKDACSETL